MKKTLQQEINKAELDAIIEIDKSREAEIRADERKQIGKEIKKWYRDGWIGEESYENMIKRITGVKI